MMLHEDQSCSCHISWKSILIRFWHKVQAHMPCTSLQDNYTVYSSPSQRSIGYACQGTEFSQVSKISVSQPLSKISVSQPAADSKISVPQSSLETNISVSKCLSASECFAESESTLTSKSSLTSFKNSVTKSPFVALKVSSHERSFIVYLAVLAVHSVLSVLSVLAMHLSLFVHSVLSGLSIMAVHLSLFERSVLSVQRHRMREFFARQRGVWLGGLSGFLLLFMGSTVQAAPQNQVNTQVEVDASVISPDMEGTFTAVKGPVPDRLLPMGPQFRIAVFNLNYALNHKMRMDTVAKALRRLNAEIILLQNVDKQTVRTGKKSDATAELAQELSMNYAYGAAQKVEGGGTTGLAILSKYPILQSEIMPLPSLSDGQGKIIDQRILLMSQIMIQGFERPIIIMNTQLDPYGKTEVQIRQIMRLNELLLGTVPYKKIDDFLTKIKILGGCFMSSAESDVMQELTPYWNHLQSDDRLAMRNYPLINPLADVDHIYTSRAQIWNLKKFEVLKGTDRGVHWERCTDHAPIVAEIQLIEQ